MQNNDQLKKVQEDIIDLYERLAELNEKMAEMANGMIEVTRLLSDLGDKHNGLVHTLNKKFPIAPF